MCASAGLRVRRTNGTDTQKSTCASRKSDSERVVNPTDDHAEFPRLPPVGRSYVSPRGVLETLKRGTHTPARRQRITAQLRPESDSPPPRAAFLRTSST